MDDDSPVTDTESDGVMVAYRDAYVKLADMVKSGKLDKSNATLMINNFRLFSNDEKSWRWFYAGDRTVYTNHPGIQENKDIVPRQIGAPLKYKEGRDFFYDDAAFLKYMDEQMERQTRLHGVDAEQQSRPHTDHGEQQSIKRKAASMSGGASASASASAAPAATMGTPTHVSFVSEAPTTEDITVEEAICKARSSLEHCFIGLPETLYFREDQCDVLRSFIDQAICSGKGGELHLSGQPGTGKKTAEHMILSQLEAAEEKRVRLMQRISSMPAEQKKLRFDKIRMVNGLVFAAGDIDQCFFELAIRLVEKKLIPAFDSSALAQHVRDPSSRKRDVEQRLRSAKENNYPLTVLVIYDVEEFNRDFIKTIVDIANSEGGKLLVITTSDPVYSYFEPFSVTAPFTVHFPDYSFPELMFICEHYSMGVIHTKAIGAILYQLAVIKGTCFAIAFSSSIL
jgi:hypothetical protein